MSSVGYLKLIIGPMYAGKSTELIRHIRQYRFLNKSILAINHSINNRYGSCNIITHDKEEITDCINVDKLEDVIVKFKSELIKCDVIIVEELQFFKDAYKYVIDFVEKYNKIVICAGLVADYKRKQFGDILQLIPIADEVKMLTALCSICKDGTPAKFSKRIVKECKQNLVGSSESYISVCRKHYLY
jgi:thymidine kinase